MLLYVGDVVLVRSRDQWISAKVLALSATHARCALSDGRTLWVANEAVQSTAAPMAAIDPFGPAPVLPEPGPAPLAGATAGPPLLAYPAPPPAPSVPVRASPWWKLGLILGLACVGLALGLFSYGFVRGYTRARQRAQARRSLQEANVVHRSADCQLTAPASWKNLEAKRIEDSPFRAVLVDSPDGVAAVLAAMWLANEDTLPAQDMGQNVAARLESPTTLLESGWVDVPGMHAWREVRTGFADNRHVTYVFYFIREKTRQIQVTAVVEPARFAQHRQQIEGIMQSARCREPSGSAQAR
jgi:hypothetical protein